MSLWLLPRDPRSLSRASRLPSSRPKTRTPAAPDRIERAEARNSLREKGLIRDDTPRAIWEISEKGREWLAEQQKAAPR